MPPRTRSCATCRKKRLKCDATLPHCLVCRRFNRQCPGLDDGPLIIDMTRKARYGMQKRESKRSPTGVTMSTNLRQAPIAPITQEAVITEAFYSRFLSYFTTEGDGKDIRNRLSWLHRLPQLSVDGTNDALALAVQATAMSYCAMETDNPTLTRHAWELYGRAIRNHGRYLARSRTGLSSVTIHMISTSVLFSLFEAIQATSADAYRLHIYGAAKMFEVTDPGQCSEGVLCQIFFHMKTQLAFAQLTSNGTRMPVDTRKILYGTLRYDELPMFQRLTTQFMKLVDIYSRMASTATGHDEQQHYLGLGDHVDMCAHVEALWQEYTSAASLHNGLTWHNASTNTTHYRDAFTALTISYFSAIRILLSVMSPQPAVSYSDQVHCYSEVLQAAQYLQTHRIGCAYMPMAAPLLLVALNSPKFDQRKEAIEYFVSWEKESMKGISELALKCIDQKQKRHIGNAQI